MDITAAFKLFDIRGEYPSQVDEKMAFVVGKSLTLLRRPKKVLVAMDARKSSPSLKNFLVDGLSTNGVMVSDLGQAPAPQFYYTVASDDFDLGVMITASHIANTENGFKLVNRNGLPFDQGELLQLKHLVTKFKDNPIVVPHIEPTKIDSTDVYLKKILTLVPEIDYRLKVVLDISGSTVEKTALPIFTKLGINFSTVESDPIGSPLVVQNQKELAGKIVSEKADLGIKWDSDGDRVVFLDRTGKMIPLSFVLGILGAATKGKVAVDVRAGLVVRDLIEEAGGELVVLPAWSQYIKFAMQEDAKICFGGETSGHLTYRDFYCIDDGLLASLRFLNQCEQGYVFEKLLQIGKKYYELPEKNFPCNFDKAPAILKSLSDYYRSKSYLVSVEDGLTVFGSDFKFNLRSSLTEPLLRLNLETRSQARAGEIIYELEKYILV